ncbi:hypothetical protein AHF37_09962 [Paragonimus kellicotti]|nr:hypothetical protein AHF37_09962 [Paragonimus kellicotti]
MAADTAVSLRRFVQENDSNFTLDNVNEEAKEIVLNHCTQLLHEEQEPNDLLNCLRCLRILSRDKHSIDHLSSEVYLSRLYDCAFLTDKLFDDKHRLEALKCLSNLIFKRPSVIPYLKSRGVVNSLLTRLKQHVSAQSRMEILTIDLKLFFLLSGLETTIRQELAENEHAFGLFADLLCSFQSAPLTGPECHLIIVLNHCTQLLHEEQEPNDLLNCLRCLRILSRDKHSIDHLSSEVYLSRLYDCAFLTDKLFDDKHRLEALKCLSNLIFKRPSVIPYLKSRGVVNSLLTRLKQHVSAQSRMEILTIDLKLFLSPIRLRDYHQSRISEFNRFCDTIRELLPRSSLSDADQREVIEQMINFLNVVPKRCFTHLLFNHTCCSATTVLQSSSNTDNMRAVQILIDFLDMQLNSSNDETSSRSVLKLEERLCPILNALIKATQGDRSIRKYCRSKVSFFYQNASSKENFSFHTSLLSCAYMENMYRNYAGHLGLSVSERIRIYSQVNCVIVGHTSVRQKFEHADCR